MTDITQAGLIKAADSPACAAEASLARGRVIRNGCLWLMLLLLIGLAVAQTAWDGERAKGWGELRQSAPRLALSVLLQAAVGSAVAILVHRGSPVLGLWIAQGLIVAAMAISLLAVPREFFDPAAARSRSAELILRVASGGPFMLLLALAALDAVSVRVYESAAVDRAGAWLTFRAITLPLVAPLVLAGIVVLAVNALRAPDLAGSFMATLLLIAAIVAGVVFARRGGR